MKKQFDVIGMSCASCQAHVDHAVNKLDGVTNCNVNLLTNSMEVDFDETKLSVEDIIKAVQKVGYDANLKEENKTNKVTTSSKKKKDYQLVKLIIAFIFMIVLFYFAMGPMFNWPQPFFFVGDENALILAFSQLLLTLPSLIFYSHYFTSGFKKLFKLHPNMDSLVALGASASLIYGIVAIFMIGYGLGHDDLELVHTYVHNLYFDSVAMILTLVSLGKYFEHLAKNKTTDAISKLINLSPKKASVLVDGKEVLKDVNEVNIGDTIVIKQGDMVPIDGKIIKGNGSFMEANITGESLPVYKQNDDDVYASTTLDAGYVQIQATKRYEDTSFQTIVKLVEEASNSKAPISKLVDKIALWFVPIILLIAIATFIGFISASYPFEDAFNFAISTLVIACPCALGLATPVAIMVSVGKGAKAGLIIKNAEILEHSSAIKTILLDKTGTITKGHPSVTDIIYFDEDKALIDRLIYSLETYSNHPLAKAITSHFKDVKTLAIKNFKMIEGQGLNATYLDEEIYLGNDRGLLSIDRKKNETYSHLQSQGKTVLFLAKNKNILALIAIKDEIKEDAKQAIAEFKKRGIEVIMLTGDKEKSARAIAKEVGIEKIIAEVKPDEKKKIVDETKAKHLNKGLVAMVGDGVNDAPALMSADIGIAIGGGSDVAIESSDIILIKDSLLDVANVIRLSRRTMITIALNLFWAFIYNVVGVLLATGAFYPSFGIKLTPMIGALCMSFSSVFVVLNALTINFFKIKKVEHKNNEEITLERKEETPMEKLTLIVTGMMCEHCKMRVAKAIEVLPEITHVDISLTDGKTTIEGNNLDEEKIKAAIKEAGYDVK